MVTTEHTEATEATEDSLPDRTGTDGSTLIHEALTGVIRQTAFAVHRHFGRGVLEKVYENALSHRLRTQGHEASQQTSITVRDQDGTVVGNYVADLVVDRSVLVEIKAVSGLTTEHYAQMLNYLKGTGLQVGMLVNFGQPRLQVKRLVL